MPNVVVGVVSALGVRINRERAMPDNVRCIDCGLLAFVQKWESNDLVRVTRKYRDSGEQPPQYNLGAQYGLASRYDDCPECYVGAADLWKEKTADGWKGGYEVACRTRSCPEFDSYVAGLGPKEHGDMLTREKLEAREDVRDAKMLSREDARDADQKKQHRFEMRLIAAVTVATLGMQYMTTRMQIQNHAKDVVEAEAKSAVQRELDSRIKPVEHPAKAIQPPVPDVAPADVTNPAK